MTALRPFLHEDSADLARLFRDSVETLAAEDYDEEQRLAWVTIADDEDAFAERLAKALTIVATEEDEAVGFASLKDGRLIDMLYVRPDVAREGVGAALVDALERLAAARGASEIEVAASDCAKPLFAARGYAAKARVSVDVGGEWLANTTMTRALEPRR